MVLHYIINCNEVNYTRTSTNFLQDIQENYKDKLTYTIYSWFVLELYLEDINIVNITNIYELIQCKILFIVFINNNNYETLKELEIYCDLYKNKYLIKVNVTTTINKKQLIIFTSFLIFLILFIFIFIFLNNEKSITKINNITKIKSDIVKPKFSISSKEN